LGSLFLLTYSGLDLTFPDIIRFIYCLSDFNKRIVMKKCCILLAMVIITTCVFIGGCAESSARVGYDFSQVYKIAVVDIVGKIDSEAARNQIADIVGRELLRKGYAPVERSQVITILNEQKFQRDASATPEQDAVKAGQVMNVPTVIIINVSDCDEDSVSMSIKMLDVQDGSMLWVGSGSGSYDKTVGTILGAGAGVATGVLISGNDHHDKVAGGVIGGVIGGAVGYMLTPEQAQGTENLIKEICKTMPSRIPAKKGLLN